MVAAVLLAVFLDGHVGQVHEHVVHFSDVGGVQLVAESAEALVVDIGLYGAVTGDQS